MVLRSDTLKERLETDVTKTSEFTQVNKRDILNQPSKINKARDHLVANKIYDPSKIDLKCKY